MGDFIEKFKELVDQELEAEDLTDENIKSLTKKIQKILKKKSEKSRSLEEDVFRELVVPTSRNRYYKDIIFFKKGPSGILFEFRSKFVVNPNLSKRAEVSFFDSVIFQYSEVRLVDELDEDALKEIEAGKSVVILFRETGNFLLVFAIFEDEFGWSIFDEKMKIVEERTFEKNFKFSDLKNEDKVDVREAFWNDIIKFGPLVLYQSEPTGFIDIIHYHSAPISLDQYFSPLKLKNPNIFHTYQAVDGYKKTVESLSELFQMFQQTLLKIAEIDNQEELTELVANYSPKKCEGQAKNGNACRNYTIDGTFCSRHRE